MPIRTIRVARSGLRWFLRWQVPILLALLIGATVGAELYLRGQPLRPYLADLIATQGADLPVHRPVDNVHLLFDLKPGARENLARPHRSDRMVTINALGMRDPERTLEKPPGTFRIVVLGSSTTFGAEVSDGETFPNYAEEILNARRDGRRYEVWNAGISSYTPHQMAAFGRRLIEQGAAPDLIVFQIFLLGPRSFLNGRINLTQYRDDPSLLDEHLVRPSWLSRATAIDLLVRSRLAGLLLAHYNRVVDQKERGAATEAASFEHHIEQLAAFVKDFGDKVRLMAIYMP
ncbi:SGNH/GDSL hydrolase family protein, partial [bacterium]|nr:SGNH/GDSL hydrolase family protein [bacterium]